MKNTKQGRIVHTRGQKFGGWFALIMFFVCGMVVQVVEGKEVVSVSENTEINYADKPESYAEKVLLRHIRNIEDCYFERECYELHSRNAVVYKKLAERTGNNKYSALAYIEEELAYDFKEIGGLVDTEQGVVGCMERVVSLEGENSSLKQQIQQMQQQIQKHVINKI